ncbi:hypothetical protein XM38_001700 [Halomicronema hongdechloris C2206]|uniref:MPN domain-containing protein n=1 Tax=Halomicronema hongdechloris C2206 TaxID=1641165 RepID=A0A1Z3HG19_9CYAN|nr:M67 family metallopeptidase [Halomicronema hongdechloris]ASC69243.1 hypothetical protein XM38_001700 [Halomicronema hongdechloris C2206]
MTLVLTADHLHQMRSHGERMYPEECCGILVGQLLPDAGQRQLLELHPADNDWRPDVDVDDGNPSGAQGESQHLSRTRRYWIDPRRLLQIQRYARDRNLAIIGIYHSHPDHDAVPSECDRTLAWPDYSYVIVSVHRGQAVDVRSWQLDETHHFQPDPLQMLSIAP